MASTKTIHPLLGRPQEWSRDQNKVVSRLYHQGGFYELHKYGEGREAEFDVHHINNNETLRTYITKGPVGSRKRAYQHITNHYMQMQSAKLRANN
jgi:hypothetical protein